MKHLQLILILTLLYACSSESKQERRDTVYSKVDTTRVAIEKNLSYSEHDALVVDKRVAVFVGPDSVMMEKRKNAIGEENFYIGADDYLFYLSVAHEFLDSAKLTIVENQDKRVLKFVREDKSQQIIQLDQQPELWAIYFFDPSKEARKVDMTAIDEEYRDYFE